MSRIRESLYNHKNVWVAHKRRETPMIIKVLNHIALLCFIAFAITGITVLIKAGNIVRAEEEARYQQLFKESSEFRLGKQEINDGDIVYKVSAGELKIYRKVLSYYEKPGRLGPTVIHIKTPCVKLELVETVSIPKHEGKFDEKIYEIEKTGEVFDENGKLVSDI